MAFSPHKMSTKLRQTLQSLNLPSLSLSTEDINILLDETISQSNEYDGRVRKSRHGKVGKFECEPGDKSEVSGGSSSVSLLSVDDDECAGAVFRKPIKSTRHIPLPSSSDTVSRQKLDAERVRSDLLGQVSALESKLEAQTRENRTLQTKLEALSKSQPQKLFRKQQSLVEDRLVSEMEMLKNNLYSLLPTDLQYVEIQAIPESKRTALDMVRGRVYEELHTLKSDNTKLRREKDSMMTTLNEVDTVRHRNKLLEEEVKHKADLLVEQHAKIKTLEHELAMEKEANDKHRKDIVYIEELRTKLAAALDEVERKDRQINDLKVQHNNEKEYHNHLESDKSELLKQIDLLKLDKAYLEKELHMIQTRHHSLEEKFARKTEELESARDTQMIQFQTILNQTEKNRNEYETRLQNELEAIRKRTGLDMEETRRNTRDFYEREISALKDSLASATEECRRNENTIEALRSANHELQQAMTSEKMKLEAEVTSLTQQMKMKSFETDRLHIIYEESVHSLKKTQLQNEKYSQKLDILTQEFHHLQSDYKLRLSELELLASARLQKLKLLGGDDVIIAPQFEANKHTHTPDNVKQLRDKLDEERTKNIRLTSEVQLLEDLLAKSREPFPAFVETVREKDSRILDLQDEIRRLETRLRALESELSKLRTERNQMAVDLESLRLNRRQFGDMKQALQDILENLTPAQRAHFNKSNAGKRLLGAQKK